MLLSATKLFQEPLSRINRHGRQFGLFVFFEFETQSSPQNSNLLSSEFCKPLGIVETENAFEGFFFVFKGDLFKTRRTTVFRQDGRGDSHMCCTRSKTLNCFAECDTEVELW